MIKYEVIKMMDKAKMKEAHIDYEVGVKRFAGKEALYEKYLLKFLDDTHFQQASDAMEKEDYEEILKAVHALKGVSGTLAIQDLYEDCSRVVADIREDRIEEVASHFKTLSEDYNRAVSFIEEMK
ncbi:MAG: Hpt domain-containing protein [Lachnospiraceae bacterium]|nr:Hpt domain-containing protein [Lachnospiraceae bacterium]